MKKFLLNITIILLLIPLNICAYSNNIILGGETIGIEVHSKGIYVVGFYKVNNKLYAEEAGFQKGDIIIEVNNTKVLTIKELNNNLVEDKDNTFKVIRNNKEKTINMKLYKEENILKTGLYVKDQINGIGTLSYIDPNTKIYGSLGHEILENTTFSSFKLEKGTIYQANISSITKSENGLTGEKNAIIDKDKLLGTINKNEVNGIYGKYEDEIPNNKTYEVGTKDEIRKGTASIKTSINDEVEEYSINIISIDESDPIKNILFEITDKKLLNKTGGIIQGMSGSPIIQNNKIIGVVNYVIIDDANKGYGIFITSMLEEGDKLLS